MVELFDRNRHQPLIESAWDAGAARAAIERIVAETRAAFTPEGLWPIHPDDAEDDERGPHTPLYFGAAGVIWGLDHLAREGAAPPGPSFVDCLADVQDRNRRLLESDAWRKLLGAGWQTRSWLLGDAGVLFTRWKTTRSAQIASALADTIAQNTDDPALELMWGAAGTMLAALAVYRATGSEPWAELYRAGARALLRSFERDEELGADIWTQHLYGRPARYLGAVHGYAGNAFVLLEGRDLLPPSQWTALSVRLASTLEATAVRSSSGANWPAYVGQRAERPLLVQHCHGAPGMVTALSALDRPVDDLLCKAGELTWTAGPLAKGANLCHGTAGNGFSFLALFERTGDEEWLARARAFAMHAIVQSDAEAARLGQRRYSLWTGDIGLACFLWECIQGSARFPTMGLL